MPLNKETNQTKLIYTRLESVTNNGFHFKLQE